MLKRVVVFILFVAICLSLPAGAKRFTHGFKIGKMRLEIPYRSDLDHGMISPEIKRILSQPFKYLDRGAQCYAFLSEDGNYVLKLFRFDQLNRFKKNRKKRALAQTVCRFFKSCELASTIASEETGVIFLHLDPTVGALPILKARGPLGRPLRLPLDQYRFALQMKAQPLEPALAAALAEGKLSKRIEEIISLLESRISKGIGNTDPSLWRNFGFLDDRAIEIDFGNFVERPDFSLSQNAKIELERYMRYLRSWLEENGPEYLPHFNDRVESSKL